MYSVLSFFVGLAFCWAGWKITAVTIVRSSLNDFFFLIVLGLVFSHYNDFRLLYNKVRKGKW